MAIWQYSFLIIPNDSNSQGMICDHKLDRVQALDIGFWSDYEHGINYFFGIEQILPRGESWSDELIIYGALDSNCVLLSEEKGIISDIEFRLDLRGDYPALLGKIASLECFKQVLLIDGEGYTFLIDSSEIVNHILTSKHFHILKNICNGSD